MITARGIAKEIAVLGLVACLAFAISGPAKANSAGEDEHQSVEVAAPKIDPNTLVADVVYNEQNAKQSASYMFRNVKQTPTGSSTKEMIETREGTVARAIAIDGKPLTPDERAQDDQKLNQLLSDPSVMAAKRKEQKDDEARISKMFGELPKAFLYEYDGTEQGNWGPLIRLKFKPNPSYQPPSRETAVYKSMSGTMLVDERAKRLVKIQATLFRDVAFGWGILGRLNQGGHFVVEQSPVGPGDWEPTFMNIQFTGKALLFKTINLREEETNSDYRKVPSDLTLSQGIDLLKKAPEQIAQNKGE